MIPLPTPPEARGGVFDQAARGTTAGYRLVRPKLSPCSVHPFQAERPSPASTLDDPAPHLERERRHTPPAARASVSQPLHASPPVARLRSYKGTELDTEDVLTINKRYKLFVTFLPSGIGSCRRGINLAEGSAIRSFDDHGHSKSGHNSNLSERSPCRMRPAAKGASRQEG